MKLKEGNKEVNFYLKEEQAKVAHLESELQTAIEVISSSSSSSSSSSRIREQAEEAMVY